MNAGSDDNDQLEGLSGILRNWESPVPCHAGIREAEFLIRWLSPVLASGCSLLWA